GGLAAWEAEGRARIERDEDVAHRAVGADLAGVTGDAAATDARRHARDPPAREELASARLRDDDLRADLDEHRLRLFNLGAQLDAARIGDLEERRRLERACLI